MEPQTALLAYIGVDLATFTEICVMVYLLVEAFKAKFASFFSGGIVKWRTDLLAILIAGGLSAYTLWGDPLKIGIMTMLCWLVPVGVNKFRKVK